MKILLFALGGHNLYAYGVGVLSAYLKSCGHKVQVMYVPFSSWEEHLLGGKQAGEDQRLRISASAILQLTEDLQPDLIGFSVITNYFEHAAYLTRELKRAYPDTLIVWGGVHPTISPAECLQYADIVCVGEGERAFEELVGRLEKGQVYSDIPNLWVKEGGKIIQNEVRPYLEDLDRLPFQDIDFSTHYLLRPGGVVSMADDEIVYQFLPHFFGEGSIGYLTMGTRGCPYACSYCYNSALRRIYRGKGKALRQRSRENFIQELVQAKRRYPEINFVIITDEAFLAGKKPAWVKEFAREYKEKVGIPFYAVVSPEGITEEAIRYLVEAGMFFVQMGLQTGSERVLREIYLRRADKKLLLDKMRILSKFTDRMVPCYDIILDNPYETKEDLQETIEFLVQIPKPYQLQLFSLTLYPGTALYERALSEGRINDFRREVLCKDYNAYDKNNYYNLLISMTPSAPNWLISYLAQRHDPLHRWGLLLAHKLYEKCFKLLEHPRLQKPVQLLKKLRPQRAPSPIEAPQHHQAAAPPQ